MKRKLQIFFGLVLAFFLLWIVFRGTEWDKLIHTVRDVNMWWLCAALVPLLASFLTRIQRWSYIVRAVHPASFRSMFSATQIGFLANFTLPLRAGEFIRAVVLGRLAGLPFSKGMALVTLDRVTDLIGLITLLALAAAAFPATDVSIPPDTFGNAAPIVVSSTVIQASLVGAWVFLVAVVAALLLILIKEDFALAVADKVFGVVSARLARKLHLMIEHFAEGLHVFRSASDMLKSVFFSLVTWSMFVLALLCYFQAFHVVAPWYAPLIVQAMVAVALSAPGAPGFVGQWHFGVVAGLMLAVPDQDPVNAKAIALVTHIVNIIPVAVVGVFCLLWEQFGLLELNREARKRHG